MCCISCESGSRYYFGETARLFMMGLHYLQIFTTTVKFSSKLSKHAKTIPQCILSADHELIPAAYQCP
jgi:hypothetical protein